jgi:hypothetical protein
MNAKGNAMNRLAGLLALAALSGCAKSSSEIQPSYVSPLQYQHLSCQQLGAEAQRVSSRASHAAGVQDNKADKDAVVTAAAVVVFWPAAFFVGGDNQTAAELARLKGEFDAIEQAAIEKNCRLSFRKK